MQSSPVKTQRQTAEQCTIEMTMDMTLLTTPQNMSVTTSIQHVTVQKDCKEQSALSSRRAG